MKHYCTLSCHTYNSFVSVSIAYVSNVNNKVVGTHSSDEILCGVQRWLFQLQDLSTVVIFTMTHICTVCAQKHVIIIICMHAWTGGERGGNLWLTIAVITDYDCNFPPPFTIQLSSLCTGCSMTCSKMLQVSFPNIKQSSHKELQ